MILIWILGFAILFFAALYAIYRKAFHSPARGQNNIYNLPESPQYSPHNATMRRLIDDLIARPFEEVTITSREGLKLFGRYYHYTDGAPLDIALHGYRGTAERDMCGGIQLSYRAGHNVLLVDQRSQGRSEGHAITFGILERYDCKAWVDYACQRFGEETPIFLYGVSMGATTALMASGLDLAGNVRGIIADCPFSSPKEIIKKVCRDMKLPPAIMYPLAVLAAKLFCGFNLNETTAADSVRNSKIPVLLLHGEDDRYVPAAMSLAIANSRPDIERHIFPGAAHGMSSLAQPQAYSEAVLNFIERHS